VSAPIPFTVSGCLLAMFNVEAFRPLATLEREVAEFAAYLKSTPPAPGFDEVLYPGEVERRRERERLVHGLEVDARTWKQLEDLVGRYGKTKLVVA
jgi:LDH2 family malate/lactate/ureidoglycolate dehydrogenase